MRTLKPDLVSVTGPSLQILGKSQMRVFPISGQAFLKKIVLTPPEPVIILT